jgi:hypothetical protein
VLCGRRKIEKKESHRVEITFPYVFLDILITSTNKIPPSLLVSLLLFLIV